RFLFAAKFGLLLAQTHYLGRGAVIGGRIGKLGFERDELAFERGDARLDLLHALTGGLVIVAFGSHAAAALFRRFNGLNRLGAFLVSGFFCLRTTTAQPARVVVKVAIERFHSAISHAPETVADHAKQ